ncbi:hypothetical protein [Echinicola shivajiensis]|uniref:hypothetical protein n=1 Tax=Echinicola shivajiensis TaxID=1035916 RepID=UPI001BFCA747|nr:hypothetical protein [Echinicola shivajiensis]
MKKEQSPEKLLQKLIDNKISREEFDQLIEGMSEEDKQGQFEEPLREHFDKFMEEWMGKEKEENSLNVKKKET